MDEKPKAKCGVCGGGGTDRVDEKVKCGLCKGSGKVVAEPKMAATLSINGDNYPATVSRVSPSGKKIWLKRDKVKRANLFEPNDEATEVMATFYEKDSHYYTKGRIYLVYLGERTFHQVREF